LIGNHDGGLITISSECGTDCDAIARKMMEFAEQGGRALEQELLSARQDSGGHE
jgi:hypothetical protein